MLVVEGSFKGGHEQDLYNAVYLANALAKRMKQPVELLIAGKVPQDLKARVRSDDHVKINWLGLVPHEQIPQLDQSAHILFPAEINAACPNSLIEALACGLPVVAYATGSMAELIGENGGEVVPYGSNYWNLEAPKIEPLTKAAEKILRNLNDFRKSARARAETHFGVEMMVEKYRQMLVEDLSKIEY